MSSYEYITFFYNFVLECVNVCVNDYLLSIQYYLGLIKLLKNSKYLFNMF